MDAKFILLMLSIMHQSIPASSIDVKSLALKLIERCNFIILCYELFYKMNGCSSNSESSFTNQKSLIHIDSSSFCYVMKQ